MTALDSKIASVITYKGVQYLKVVSGIRIFITSNDLRGHPVRRSNEGIPPAHCSVQLSTDTKIHYGQESNRTQWVSDTNLSNVLLLNIRQWSTLTARSGEKNTARDTSVSSLLRSIDKQMSTKDESDCLISSFHKQPCASSSLPGGNEKKSQFLILMRIRVRNTNKQQPLFYVFFFIELRPAKCL